MTKELTDKRLLIVQSEFGGALQAIKRDGSLLSTVLRDGWDGRDLATLVKQSPLRATNPHISVIGHVTKSELIYLMDQVSMVNGLGNRFLFTCVRRSNILPFGGKPAAAGCDQTRGRGWLCDPTRSSDWRGAMVDW